MNDRKAGRHPDREALHRYAEDRLREEGAGRELERHLEGCADCRREVRAIRELLRRTAELPREIEPARDLWPGVEARIRADVDRRGPVVGESVGDDTDAAASISGFREAAPWLAAAAAVLVALTAGAALWLADGRVTGSGGAEVASGPPADTPRGGWAALVELGDVEANYRPMVDRLSEVLRSRGDRLPPDTREVVERNLEIIDAAIAEAESALAEHPASPELLRALDRSYQRKVDLLRRSARLAAEM